MEGAVDVVIVGGGPAGLSAALMLGRAGRKVVVCDHGRQRNRWAVEMHGYLSRDRIPPREFLELAHRDLQFYPSVKIVDSEVTDVRPADGRFSVTLADGSQISARKVLLATGVCDEFPDIPGFEELYGKFIHHCPYCDGWEVRGQRLGVYGNGEKVVSLALKLTGWTRNLAIFTNGPETIPAKSKSQLTVCGIEVFTSHIGSMERAEDGMALNFDDGTRAEIRALFFVNPVRQHSNLPEKLGCAFNDVKGVDTDKHERTCVPGIFAAGNMIKEVEFVIVAAAEGAKAALGINQDLIEEDLAERGIVDVDF